MISRIKQLIWQCYANRVLRYIFFGGLTTLVNLGVYYTLRLLTALSVVQANTISVSTAVLFAYIVNSRFVFETKAHGFSQHFNEFIKFISARIVTMIIEVGGVWLMADVMHINDFIAKIVIQAVIIVLNYIFSKLLVFTQKG